jgi:hypothetical protein
MLDGVSELRTPDGRLVGHYVLIGGEAQVRLTDETRALYAANLATDPYEKEEYSND